MCGNLCEEIFENHRQACLYQSLHREKDEISDPKNKGYVSYNVTFDHLANYARSHNIKADPATDEIEYGFRLDLSYAGGLKKECILVLRGGGVYPPD